MECDKSLSDLFSVQVLYHKFNRTIECDPIQNHFKWCAQKSDCNFMWITKYANVCVLRIIIHRLIESVVGFGNWKTYASYIFQTIFDPKKMEYNLKNIHIDFDC